MPQYKYTRPADKVINHNKIVKFYLNQGEVQKRNQWELMSQSGQEKITKKIIEVEV